MKTRSRFLPRLSLRQRKNMWGYVFTLPFTIGFLAFFVGPLIQSLTFSLGELEVTPFGFNLHYVGLDNYRYALRTDPNFLRVFTETTLRILTDIPAVIVFSFFIATVLNQRFRGRMLARIVFFLPVILTSGIIARMEGGDWLHQTLQYVADAEEQSLFSARSVMRLLGEVRLPVAFIDYITTAINRIPDIIQAAAIPILVFLAGLQSIAVSLYEAAKIEGATSWETFWKITFPLISPLFLTNIVFIIVDSFTAPGNRLVSLIDNTAWMRGIYGVSVAMTWLYFGVVALFLVITVIIVSRYVFYME